MRRVILLAWAALSLTACMQRNTAAHVPEEAVRTLCEYMASIYPQATLQDLYKTCYQDFFGAGHVISDTAAARAYLHQEYAQALELSRQINTDSLPCQEPTGFRHRFMRIYLYYDWSLTGISEEDIFQAFLSVGQAEPVHDHWADEWAQIETIALQVHPEWKDNQLQALLHQAARNNQAVHHSTAYREAYHPHYRICKHEGEK